MPTKTNDTDADVKHDQKRQQDEREKARDKEVKERQEKEQKEARTPEEKKALKEDQEHWEKEQEKAAAATPGMETVGTGPAPIWHEVLHPSQNPPSGYRKKEMQKDGSIKIV